jgi:glycosyltransferase involved in cell wall biosynthesis
MSLTTPEPDLALPVDPVKLDGLSVVLPCLDEAGNLPRVLDAWRRACIASARRWELIVVDDGSTDATGRVALTATRRWGDVTLVSHARNLGYGAAVRSGIRAAREPWILLTDGDGQFDPFDLSTFAPLAQRYDVVAGYRLERADSIVRRANGALWSALMRHMLDLPVRDVDCAFKLLRTELVRDLPVMSDGAMVSAELLARLLRDGARLVEVPVRHRPRTAGRSTGARPRVIARALRELQTVRRALPPTAAPLG